MRTRGKDWTRLPVLALPILPLSKSAAIVVHLLSEATFKIVRKLKVEIPALRETKRHIKSFAHLALLPYKLNKVNGFCFIKRKKKQTQNQKNSRKVKFEIFFHIT